MMHFLSSIMRWWRGPPAPCEPEPEAPAAPTCRVPSPADIEAKELEDQVTAMTKANGLATMEAVKTSHRAIRVEHAARGTLADLMTKMDRGQ